MSTSSRLPSTRNFNQNYRPSNHFQNSGKPNFTFEELTNIEIDPNETTFPNFPHDNYNDYDKLENNTANYNTCSNYQQNDNNHTHYTNDVEEDFNYSQEEQLNQDTNFHLTDPQTNKR